MKDITSMRSTIEFLKEQGEILITQTEVDPVCEVCAIQKALDNGPALLYETIKGYPNARFLSNWASRDERVAKIFDLDDPHKMKFRMLDAQKNPIPPKVVDEAPCQEVVITKDIDLTGTLPIIQQTPDDVGRLFGSGETLLMGKYFEGGTHISHNRMSFRGKDWSSLATSPGTHMEDTCSSIFRGQKIPVTLSITTPPAVFLIASGGGVHMTVPRGTDELGIAGGLQGSPVEIVKAKTVDAYAIAQSEWVIEGYIDTTQKVWETDEAEKLGRQGVTPFFPEWPHYMGTAYKTWKFQATAITHRRDKPIFWTHINSGFEVDYLIFRFGEACYYEIAERMAPSLVLDCNILNCLLQWGGVVFQVKKRRPRDDGLVGALLTATLGIRPGLRMAIAVDEDINIYSADDVLWAITTRFNPARMIRGGGGSGTMAMPAEAPGPAAAAGHAQFIAEGGMGIDATVPFDTEIRRRFRRPKFAVDGLDLKRWFSEADITSAKAQQCDYARFMAETGR